MVGDPRLGRTVVYIGDIHPLNSTVEVTCGAGLLVHNATFTDEEAEQTKQAVRSTAREAACVTHGADMRRLALMHISTRCAANLGLLLEQAREVYDGETSVAEDGQKLEVPYADNDGDGAETGE